MMATGNAQIAVITRRDKTSETYHAERQPEELQMAGCHPNLISPCAIVEKKGGNRQIHTFGRLHCQTRQTFATFRRI